MVATEEAVEVVVATAVVVVVMEVAVEAVVADMAVAATAEAGTRLPVDAVLLQKKHYVLRYFPFMLNLYYSAMQYCKDQTCISCILHPNRNLQSKNSAKNPEESTHHRNDHRASSGVLAEFLDCKFLFGCKMQEIQVKNEWKISQNKMLLLKSEDVLGQSSNPLRHIRHRHIRHHHLHGHLHNHHHRCSRHHHLHGHLRSHHLHHIHRLRIRHRHGLLHILHGHGRPHRHVGEP